MPLQDKDSTRAIRDPHPQRLIDIHQQRQKTRRSRQPLEHHAAGVDIEIPMAT